jgi:hypothetical protein
MSATLTKSTVTAVIERSDPADDFSGDSRRRSTAETEADKVRRQQQLRRKTTLARRALAAHQTR